MPIHPFIANGEEAIRSVAGTPRWSTVDFSESRISRPQEGQIVVAYKVVASREGTDDYTAYCTSTYRRLEHEEWRVIQHQQMPPISGGGQSKD